jgi:hypothetical protein
MTFHASLLCAALMAVSCDAANEPGYRYDDLLRLNHIQAKGSHNSYHLVDPDTPLPKYDYSHAPIDEQLSRQGVRQFELDVHYYPSGEFVVYHNDGDDQSTCPLLTDCLRVLKDWSDDHPGHHALFVFVEIKEDKVGIDPEALNQALDEQILSVWPRERIVAPDDVQGDYPTMWDALADQGWPTLGETRDKILFILLDMAEWRDSYTRGGTSTRDRVLFAESLGDLEIAGIARLDAPFELEGPIREAVEAKNLIVRTRADTEGVEARANDFGRLNQALETGAHLICTDFPAPVDEHDYWVEIPDGTPSRCNPLTAPNYCTPKSIEHPGIVHR